MHAASLGEYEQGLPLLEKLKKDHPQYQFLLTFFSPSGFEVKKDKTPADVVVYLPLDTKSNADRFLQIVNPRLVIFIKYEIWPNYLHELNRLKTPTLLVSAIFSKKQFFFKPFGGFMRKSLKSFLHFFVQDENSKVLLKTIGFENCSVSGDTRFDRVSQILKSDSTLDFMETFKSNQRCFVAGSTWPEDEAILMDYINTTNEKVVIAPHNIKEKHIEKMIAATTKTVVKYSDIKKHDLKEISVLLIDTIGLLTKIYGYADIAYVGGGFATGLHNTLEPAVFGIPVIIGPNYEGFKEAEDLVAQKGIFSVSDKNSFNTTVEKLWNDNDHYKKTGNINHSYVQKQQGATKEITTFINSLL